MGFFDTIFGKKTPDSGESDYEKQKSWGWEPLTDVRQLEDIEKESHTVPVVIFKHSTRCGISRMAYRNFESEMTPGKVQAKFYYLDLLEYRDVSNAIATRFGVMHQSPQLILIRDGKAVYSESHGEISAPKLMDILKG
ncbi:bacillithiol system redox-active protein YtxJ [Sinomicrobium sp. M5D2P9]